MLSSWAVLATFRSVGLVRCIVIVEERGNPS